MCIPLPPEPEKVIFQKPQVSSEGRTYIETETDGFFIAFAEDYKIVVIRDKEGNIHRIPHTKVQFKDW
jgi:hypothetical protein